MLNGTKNLSNLKLILGHYLTNLIGILYMIVQNLILLELTPTFSVQLRKLRGKGICHKI